MPALRNPQRERFARLLGEEYLGTPPSPSPAQTAFERAGYKPDQGNCYRLANHPEVRQRVRELTAEAREYSDIRIAKAAVKLDHIASASIADFYDWDGRLKTIHTLPNRLAEAIREVEFGEYGRPKRVRLHDKLAALTVLLRHLGGLPPAERPADVTNNTQVNVITDEQRIAAVMSLLARARETTIDCDSTQGPAEQSPVLIQKTH